MLYMKLTTKSFSKYLEISKCMKDIYTLRQALHYEMNNLKLYWTHRDSRLKNKATLQKKQCTNTCCIWKVQFEVIDDHVSVTYLAWPLASLQIELSCFRNLDLQHVKPSWLIHHEPGVGNKTICRKWTCCMITLHQKARKNTRLVTSTVHQWYGHISIPRDFSTQYNLLIPLTNINFSTFLN